MNIKNIIAAGFGALTLSTTAMAYETEREYLLDLYHGVDSRVLQSNEQQEPTSQETQILFVDLIEGQRPSLENSTFFTHQTPR